jgi:HlyD family secretion protein
MQVDTAVAEADVGKLAPGMEASFQVDAFPGERFKGKVRQIRNAPQTLQNVVTYDAVIDVENADLRLKPGMTANVTFVWAERDGVLRVPNASLRFRPVSKEPAERPAGGFKRPPADEKSVYLLVDGQPVQRKVKTGVTDGTFTEVLEGVAEGEVVITDSTDSQAAGGGERRRGGQGGGLRRVF